MEEKNYAITVTMYVDAEDENDAREQVYNVLDVVGCGIQDYSIDNLEEVDYGKDI